MPFSADEMLALVADIERYPEFLPLCESLVVRERRETEAGEHLVATMGIGYKSIRERFTTRVEVEQRERRISVENIDGPFRVLRNTWHFVPVESPPAVRACDVDFDIVYEFRSPLLAVLMGSVFDTAVRRFADAFEERAHVVYGNGPRT